MAFISMADELLNKSLTCINNKFITKYLPILDPTAVKVYIFALHVAQSGQDSVTTNDFATRLKLSEEDVINYFKYLEEFELLAIASFDPLKIRILDCENVSGAPKKYKAEKYSNFSKTIQTIIAGRMISPNEYREYFNLLEDYGFEHDALIMIITYCVNLKGDNIRVQYIKKVAKNFAEDGDITARQVEERLSAYTSSTPSLIRIFTAVGIKKQPDFEDDVLYKKWTNELGFDDDAIIATAKCFKVKSTEKIDVHLTELYKNKKFDVKEISDYCKNKNIIYDTTVEIARALGVYVQTVSPYVENYSNAWFNLGFNSDTLKKIATYCFLNNKNSFELMNEFVNYLYENGYVTIEAIDDFIVKENVKVSFIKKILTECGLSRKVIDLDKKFLQSWKSWNFSDEMIMQACKLSAGKSNPLAYMNSILSSWKNQGIFSPSQVASLNASKSSSPQKSYDKKAEIESHYAELRRIAEERADKIFQTAIKDKTYAELYKDINSLTIKLAFAELSDEKMATELKTKIEDLEQKANERLIQLGISKDDFTPKYSCSKCNDTGYDKNGNQCECFKKLLK